MSAHYPKPRSARSATLLSKEVRGDSSVLLGVGDPAKSGATSARGNDGWIDSEFGEAFLDVIICRDVGWGDQLLVLNLDDAGECYCHELSDRVVTERGLL